MECELKDPMACEGSLPVQPGLVPMSGQTPHVVEGDERRRRRKKASDQNVRNVKELKDFAMKLSSCTMA